MGREDARELDGLFRYASNMFASQEKAAITRVLTGGTPDELQRSLITAAARQIGITTDTGTVAGRLVERTILRGYATLLDELRHPLAEIPRVFPTEEKPAPPASFIFTEFWKSFERHKLDNREWKADTASNAEGTKNVFDKLFPAVTVAQLVATPIASDFKSKLLLLPRHYARGERKKMSAEKLIALGRTLPTRDQMQGATANKHFGNFSEYWLYLVGQKKIPADIPNPFHGLHITLKRGRNARKERNNWTQTMEKALFESIGRKRGTPRNSTPTSKAIESADERLAQAYQQIKRADEELAPVSEQVAKMERDDAHPPSAGPAPHSSPAKPAFRPLVGLVLTGSIVVAALILHSSYGAGTKLVVTRWAPQLVSILPLENLPLSGQPAPSTVAEAAPPQQATPLTQTD
jgi:hypothetical protein